MGTKPIRVQESDYETLRSVADQNDTTPAQVVAEILSVHVDLDEIQGNGSGPVVGACPECGAEINSEQIDTGVLTGSVWVTCPEYEIGDETHEQNRYELDELDDA